MKKRIIIFVGILVVIVIGIIAFIYFSQNKNTTKEPNNRLTGKSEFKLTDYSYDGGSKLKMDLDGDNVVDKVNLEDKKIAYIVDLNNNGKLELIEENVSTMISPSSTSYTLYNYKNKKLVEVGCFSVIGSIPNDTVYVKGNTIYFTYKPLESAPGYTEKVECEIKP